MIGCIHKTIELGREFCGVASRIAGVQCEVNYDYCKICSSSKNPRQVNKATLAIATHNVGLKSQKADEIRGKYASILAQPSKEEMQKRRIRRVTLQAKCRSMHGVVMWDGSKWLEIEPCLSSFRSDCNCQAVVDRDGEYVGEVLSIECGPGMDPDVKANVEKYNEVSSTWTASPVKEDWVIVTSLSPMPHHQESQDVCLRSWARLGAKIYSGNLPSEIELLRSKYSGVEFVEVRGSNAFERQTPRIYDLMQIGGNVPKLLINSDIEILGDGSRISAAAADGSAIVGIRYNWAGSRAKAQQEHWGLDVFMLHPNQIATFPDIDFAIGQVMWDYWIPFHLNLHGFKIDWIGQPYFYHAAHEIHWQSDSFPMAQKMLDGHYKIEDIYEDWAEWRREQPYNDMVT
jgi:hypothetical protein